MQPCPTCGSSVADIAYVYEDGDERSDFFRCPDCSFLFARPVFIPELDSRQMDGIENAELFNSRLLKSIYINYFIKKCDGDVLKSLTKSRFRLDDQGESDSVGRSKSLHAVDISLSSKRRLPKKV
jgi:hypothetical protein